MSVPVKKVRAFLKKQHGELIAVKKKHIRAGLEAVNVHKKKLAKKLDEWTDGEGNFNATSWRDSKKWAATTAVALGVTTARAIRNGSQDAADLASDHAQQWSDFAADEFGDDLNVSDDDFSIDDDRIDDLQQSYIGNTRRGVYASLLKVASAVVASSSLSDLADTVGADSDSTDDIAESIFSPVESRTEMYIRTETGDAYGLALANATSDDEETQKRWATIDPGCDGICHDADGQVVDMDDDFEMGDGSTVDYPPAHPNCLAPGTLIETASGTKKIEQIVAGDEVFGGLSGKPRRVTRVHVNDHAGSAIIVESENGTVTLTDNHPILTRRGWVTAGELNERDRVAAYVGGEFAVPMDGLAGESHNRPASGDQRGILGGVVSPVMSAVVPSAWVDFDGDLGTRDCDVNTEHLEMELRHGFNSSRVKQASESVLDHGSFSDYLSGAASFQALGDASLAPADRVVRGGDLKRSFLGCHFGRSNDTGRTAIPPRQAGASHPTANGYAGYSHPVGNFKNRESFVPVETIDLRDIDIEFVHVRNVSRVPYTGKVFNLSVDMDHSYIANGIVVHNCDCVWTPWRDDWGHMKSTDDIEDDTAQAA